MDCNEYEKVKNFTYRQYCDYLKQKYGNAKFDYFSKSFVKNPRISRTKEGLYCHHIFEDSAIDLSNPIWAKKHSYEYQKAENLCYCDLLEHLFLHILICEYPMTEEGSFELVGIGGVINFFVPELNDLYSGFKTMQPWQKFCHDKVINDKDVYIMLVKRFYLNHKDFNYRLSLNERFGTWHTKNNSALFSELDRAVLGG